MKIESGCAPMVAAVHDLSCVGRCALTVVIPALAAMGIQPVPLPTAVLSTHTGGYNGMAVRDLSGFMPECIEHWKTLGIRFSAVYSGYLADVGQVDTVRKLIEWQKQVSDALAVVDPVMGDGGKLYSAMPKEMPEHMLKLCSGADVITPNLTEASLMLGIPYPDGPMKTDELISMLERFEAKAAVLTSVTLTDGRHVNACRIRDTGEIYLCAYERIPVHFPGTGDLFASVLTGEMLRGSAPQEAMRLATAFLERTIAESHGCGAPVREGVQLERALKYLLDGSAQNMRAEIERIK
ncbi:MAG: pyridoxamine kinase [Clostridia bacterium]|nr:pyridoxamine kinase [Clostridia bacterium]